MFKIATCFSNKDFDIIPIALEASTISILFYFNKKVCDMDYIARMNEILAEKVANGMKGIRFFVEAESGAADFAHDFCVMEDAIKEGNVDTVCEPCS